MPNVRVSDLQDSALDWAVAKAEGLPIARDPMGFRTGSESGFWIWEESGYRLKCYGLIGREYSPSTKWEQGGPIVDKLRELSRHQLLVESGEGGVCVTSWPIESAFCSGHGVTILDASMRCYVASKLGGVVDVPASLSDLG